MIPKKSSGMQKPYVWRVTPPTKNQHKNSILVHSVYGTKKSKSGHKVPNVFGKPTKINIINFVNNDSLAGIVYEF